MIAMLIADGSPRERSAITQEAHEQAAKHTDEYWKWIICENRDQLKEVIAGDPRLHMACVDITMQGAVEIARSIRTISAETYMILVADTSVSPTVYMRPSIGAESLLLRPLDDIQIREVLDDRDGFASGSDFTNVFYASDLSENFINMIDNIFKDEEKKVKFLNFDLEREIG